ncbi:MAG: P-loop-containing protein [Acidimicrobiales bacterium]
MAAATAGYTRTACTTPFAHDHLSGPSGPPGWPTDGVVELGVRRATFAGTDALGMSVQPKVIGWLSTPVAARNLTLVVGEGDRLANDRFFQAMTDAGWELHVLVLAATLSAAAERRAARGSTQNEAWVRGRITKTVRLAQRWGAHRVEDGPPAAVAAALQEKVAELVDSGHTRV